MLKDNNFLHICRLPNKTEKENQLRLNEFKRQKKREEMKMIKLIRFFFSGRGCVYNFITNFINIKLY